MSTPEEDAKIEAGKVQSFYNMLSSDVVDNEPFFKVFKRAEIDATMSAASAGAFHTYWDMAKITDLNNKVDESPDCAQKLKDIFGSGSRNPRIRGNRIGQAIFERVKEMMTTGVTSAAPSAPKPTPPVATTSSTNPTPTPSAQTSSEKLLGGRALTQYKFSHDLPPESQLRVRSAPSMEGEAIGTVTSQDVILGAAEVRTGDWLRVQIQGWEMEAWILTQMGNTTLLVPVDERQTTQPPQQQEQPGERTPMPQQQQHQQHQVPTASPIREGHRPHTSPARSLLNASQNLGQPRQGYYAGSQQQQQMYNDPMAMSMPNMTSAMMHNSTMMGGATMMGDQPMEGQPVPYELYRRLEMRVNRLELDLNNLKMALRSI